MTDLQVGANNDFFGTATGTLDVVSKAAHQGAIDAREAANRTWAASALFVSRFVYTTCYTVSYGVVFPATMLSLAIPKENAAIRGMIDGARAAMDRLDRAQGAPIDSVLPTHLPV